SPNDRILSIGQDESKAGVEVETPEGIKKLEADYIVGYDGANSQVRRSLFGDWEFPGFTRTKTSTNTATKMPTSLSTRSIGTWHPESPKMACGELPAKFERIFPGHPKPDKCKLANFSPYKVHQRLAKKMGVGHFLLAADAAHLCNPFGGLGLTGGIVDVGGLFDCLIGIHKGNADASILDKYDEIRRWKYSEVINLISTENIKKLFGQNPDTAIENDEFLKLCKKTETDPVFSKEFSR
ncbi:related to monooxygenase, partial [Phialocephala subalpina]